MASPLMEKCLQCEVGMAFRTAVDNRGYARGNVVFNRKCCNDCRTESYQQKVEEYQKGLSLQNPCAKCSTYDHCSEQIRMGRLD